MHTLEKLFSSFPPQVSVRYLSRAFYLLDQLNAGTNLKILGGRYLQQNRRFIRFKLGHYRLIIKNDSGVIKPQVFLHRKNLESYIKRRCS
ncbi:MAG: hypothetical protein HRU23_10095 [Gammaproteobacteria bacterium]|nr:hypothetical protein [Gammaproteobacteria bacterium]